MCSPTLSGKDECSINVREETALVLWATADRDAAVAAVILTDPTLFEAAGFHLQQEAEKRLKAWLLIAGVVPPRTHDLGVLLDLAKDNGLSVPEMRVFTQLSEFAVRLRYASGTDVDAEVVEKVEAVVSEFRTRLAADIRATGLPLPGDLPYPVGVKVPESFEPCPCGSKLQYRECHGRPGA